MKKIVSIISFFFLLLITSGCDDGSVSSSEVLNNCESISGTYSGSYSDTSCKGTTSSETISSFTIADGCSTKIQGYLLSAKGSITNIDSDGDTFDVRIENPPNSDCGGLSGYCTKTATSPITYKCLYNWDDGGHGTIHISQE